ncbi:MAG TPA: TetR/AcrR family transcriptional regulator [Steroidobacteraceae bacterium]|nr:TetR/AcrR family transcriptional regulator [Steroidobacteraceae bacterium]
MARAAIKPPLKLAKKPDKPAVPAVPAVPAAPHREGARERILATAHDLIYREGARAVGIDRIVAESGVAKMSLYRWFPSKDDLIVAVLHEQERLTWEVWHRNIERYSGAPLKQLRAQFESLTEVIAHPDTRGCAFLNVAVELADESHPARAVVRKHKAELTERLAELAVDAGLKHPRALAEQLMVVGEGAHAISQSLGKNHATSQLMSIVDALIAAHMPLKRS